MLTSCKALTSDVVLMFRNKELGVLKRSMCLNLTNPMLGGVKN